MLSYFDILDHGQLALNHSVCFSVFPTFEEIIEWFGNHGNAAAFGNIIEKSVLLGGEAIGPDFDFDGDESARAFLHTNDVGRAFGLTV